ncbi:unnamed protein product [Adineta steineri]|uniref:Uncharacterized protein n=1 Tax=Adineta steineri TaxID=433720 RepID=A0A814GXF8_9BILA|nr:unnamed protein product [Adineta steineri]
MKSVLITGANRGIGYGLVKQFLKSKTDHVFASYREMDRSKELFDLAKEHSATIVPLQLGCGCCSAWPLTYFGSENQNTEAIKLKFRGVSTFITLLAFVWWIVDWARILGNKFADGNGEALMY